MGSSSVRRQAVLRFAAAAALFGFATADENLANMLGHRQICGGVYSAEDAGGSLKPSITVSFPEKQDTAGNVAIVIYPYDKRNYLGYMTGMANGRETRGYMCTDEAVYSHFCSEEDLGKVVVDSHVPEDVKNVVLSTSISVSKDEVPEPLEYHVEKTAYWCVASLPGLNSENMKYSINVHFQNPFGELPGGDYPLIMFHFIFCIVYAALMLLWTVPLAVYRHNVLKVQKYITALGFLMILEQFFVSLYYFITNKQGHSSGSKALLSIVAIWGSARLAYTFFLLLLVANGYSVVHPSLGPRMKWCRILGLLLFVSALVFSMLDYYEENSGASTGVTLEFFASIAFMPLVMALAANYFFTLKSLQETLSYLRSRKQTAKVSMYRRLSWILIGSALAIAGLMVVQIIQMLTKSQTDFINSFWKYKWVLSDGWPNIVYCIAFMLVMFLWRPNSDNKRYAMSTQLAQSENDAEEFEIGSLNGSDDEEAAAGFDPQFDRAPSSPPPFSHDAGSGVGAQRETMFDADTNHELSDLEGGEEFEIDERDHPRNPEDDEDPLFAAPSGRLASKGRRSRNKRK